MLRERIVWVAALVLVAGIGFYSGNTIGARASEQNRAQAAQQFFSQRGGGQGGGQGGQGGFARGGNGGGVFGTVTDVSGNTITINTRNGQTTKIQLAANGTVRKQVDAQISDITSGQQITAFGTQSGDTFQATNIQIGGGFGGRQGGGGRNATQVPAQQ